MLTSFSDVYASIKASGVKKRMIAAWAVDEHTIEACAKAIELGIVDVTLVGDAAVISKVCEEKGIDASVFTVVDEPVELEAVATSVRMVRNGEGDVIMKGLCSTDKFLRAILNKETGILPPKGLLCHIGVMESPNYHKLLFMGDMAVIPLPDLRQKSIIASHVASVARSFGVKLPKVAFVAATEQVIERQPATVEAAALAKMTESGEIQGCVAQGPLALDVALDKESAQIKKIAGPVAGDADCLVFPNLESSNVFWKTNSKLCTGVRLAGMLVGTTAPCVLASRADSVETKLDSIAEAVMFACAR